MDSYVDNIRQDVARELGEAYRVCPTAEHVEGYYGASDVDITVRDSDGTIVGAIDVRTLAENQGRALRCLGRAANLRRAGIAYFLVLLTTPDIARAPSTKQLLHALSSDAHDTLHTPNRVLLMTHHTADA